MRLLNVGGGHKSIPIPSKFEGWDHLMLDIDERSEADVIADARYMTTLTRWRGHFDAIYSSHNLEHFHQHEIPLVLAGFKHCLNGSGFAMVQVPNMEWVCQQVASGLDLEQVVYESPMGPVRAIDMIYGHAAIIQNHQGNSFMCHKTGFSPKSLGRTFLNNGFEHVFIGTVASDIVCYAFMNKPTEEQEKFCLLKYENPEAPPPNLSATPSADGAGAAGPTH